MQFTKAVIVGAIALAACRSDDSHVEKDLRATYPESFSTSEPYTVYDMQTRAEIPVGVQRTTSTYDGDEWRSTDPESFDTSTTYAPGTPETIGSQSFTSAERDFIAEAASAGRFEVQTSQLALQKGVTGELRGFAERMIAEHEEVNSDLERIARKRKVEIPVEFDSKHDAMLEELRRLDGQEFAKRYYDLQVTSHEQMVRRLEAAVRDCDNMEVRTIAQRALDSTRQHLEQLKDMPIPR